MNKILANLESLGISLPRAPKAAANYSPFVCANNLLIISGQLPSDHNGIIPAEYKGKLGKDISAKTATLAAKQCALNILAQAKIALSDDLGKLKRCLRLGGFINSTADYPSIPLIMNGASDLILAVLGKENGSHARATVGVAQLPLDACVEVEAMFEID